MKAVTMERGALRKVEVQRQLDFLNLGLDFGSHIHELAAVSQRLSIPRRSMRVIFALKELGRLVLIAHNQTHAVS